ncbi:hypothetical protein BH11PSE12_BH11PSE12_08330 [soil metagenome]
MPYCTKADLINAYGEQELIQLTDRENALVIDDAVLNTAIATAEAEINVWLEGRYPLPLASVPLVLKRIACDVTRFGLCGDIADDHPAARRHSAQLKVLRAIADGKASLGLDLTGAVALPADTVQVSAGRNDFGDRSSW